MADVDSDGGQKKEEEVDTCWLAFKAFDHESSEYMNTTDLKFALEHMGVQVTEDDCFRMIMDADPENIG